MRWRCGLAGLVLAVVLGFAAAASAQPSTAATNEPADSQPRTSNIIPAQPYHLPPEKLAKAKVLGRIRPLLHFGEELWQIALLWLLLSSGTAVRLAERVYAGFHRSWLQTLVFSAILTALIYLAVDLPLEAIGHTFSLHYGISVEGWPAWLLDEAKTLGLTVLVETPLLMLALALVRRSPRLYWLWFAAAAVPVMLLFTFLLPPLVEPLFYDFEPLAQSHPALVQQLQKVVERTGTSIPPERMFLMKASEKSNGLNAYVSGIGSSKRIVVWDTTADRMPTDEILFTFAHESGHYVLDHIPKGLTLAAMGMFALFWMVARLAESLVHRLGLAWHIRSLSNLSGLVVLLLALSVLQFVTEPIECAISRHFEHEADVYGQEAIHGLVPDPQKTAVGTFSALGETSLDDPDPNPFVVFWSYDHPSIQGRAQFAAHYDPWRPGQTPQFFAK
ncbi:MAG TPA: M48 family metalloprotease [Acidobacteriaceae bacterium]|nr:M48 family metalloprotease [Acidobacteriaceae bacterium]